MSTIAVFNSVSLDGVMQAPGRSDEDTRGGFTHGGWARQYVDAVMGRVMAEGMADAGPLLLGRRTYEDFYSFWPHQKDDPISDVLNSTQKYVASRTLTEPLPWQNSTLLKGDAVDTVAQLKKQPGKDITILGSGNLIRSLIPHRLIDRYVLLIHPLLLGTGLRHFPHDGEFTELRLVDSVTTTTGVIIATYELA
jgi:dihydrofolate reductase